MDTHNPQNASEELDTARQRVQQFWVIKERVYHLYNLVRDFNVYDPDETYHNQFDDELLQELEMLLRELRS
jgi:hypothetical protein